MSEVKEKEKVELDKSTSINVLDLISRYQIGNIPIIYFVLIYIILIILNRLYNFTDTTIILVSTIPISIMLAVLFNNVKITPLVFSILAITIIFLIYLIR